MRDGPCSGSGTSIFLIATIHDFVMLDALAEAASTRAGVAQDCGEPRFQYSLLDWRGAAVAHQC
jgi:hypothetical protein